MAKRNLAKRLSDVPDGTSGEHGRLTLKGASNARDVLAERDEFLARQIDEVRSTLDKLREENEPVDQQDTAVELADQLVRRIEVRVSGITDDTPDKILESIDGDLDALEELINELSTKVDEHYRDLDRRLKAAQQDADEAYAAAGTAHDRADEAHSTAEDARQVARGADARSIENRDALIRGGEANTTVTAEPDWVASLLSGVGTAAAVGLIMALWIWWRQDVAFGDDFVNFYYWAATGIAFVGGWFLAPVDINVRQRITYTLPSPVETENVRNTPDTPPAPEATATAEADRPALIQDLERRIEERRGTANADTAEVPAQAGATSA